MTKLVQLKKLSILGEIWLELHKLFILTWRYFQFCIIIAWWIYSDHRTLHGRKNNQSMRRKSFENIRQLLVEMRLPSIDTVASFCKRLSLLPLRIANIILTSFGLEPDIRWRHPKENIMNVMFKRVSVLQNKLICLVLVHCLNLGSGHWLSRILMNKFSLVIQPSDVLYHFRPQTSVIFTAHARQNCASYMLLRTRNVFASLLLALF